MERLVKNPFNDVARPSIGPVHAMQELQKGYDVVWPLSKPSSYCPRRRFLPSQPLIESMGDNMAASIAQKSPYPTTVEAGKSYFWCACGLSKSQPFCDGSHKGSEFVPLKWEATVSQTVYFCGCKQAKGPPFCDGSHNRL